MAERKLSGRGLQTTYIFVISTIISLNQVTCNETHMSTSSEDFEIQPPELNLNHSPSHTSSHSPEHTPNHTVNHLSEHTPNHTVNSPPEHTPNHTVNSPPEHTPHHTVNPPPEYTPHYTVNVFPEHTPNHTGSSLPEHTLNHTPEHTPPHPPDQTIVEEPPTLFLGSPPPHEDHSTSTEEIDSKFDVNPTKFFSSGSSITSSSSVHTAGGSEDLFHPCVRKCSTETSKKRCYYEFKVEWYTTMSKACYNCPFNVTDCLRPHCVQTDGHEKPIVTVNRRMPGPLIQVCEGDDVIVDVINELGSDTTSIHWHGLHQKGTPYMDGVPFLTQCPIQPGTSFRYHFLAHLPGTHYWHSHSGFQRTDGMFGLLVVQGRNDPQSILYDVDDPRHVMILTDWLERLGIAKFINHHHTEHDNKPYNILVNGIGIAEPLEKEGELAHTPFYEYRVQQGLRYRFRSVSNSIQNCPIEISVDNHTLLVIASDGHNINPVEVESLVIYGGERWDFVINANQPRASYWVKFRGLLDCDERFKSAFQIALLRYEGVEGLPEPPENVTYDSTRREGMQLNKLNSAPGDLETFLTAADMRSHNPDQVGMAKYTRSPNKVDGAMYTSSPNEVGGAKYAKTPDQKFWLDFDFYSRDNDLFHHQDFYPFFGVEKGRRLYMPQINNISLRLPNVPPLSQPDDLDEKLLCNSSSRTDCQDGFCHCSHVLNLDLGSLVELILVDTGVVYWANHPFHLHGHAFAVMGMGRLGEQTTLDAIKDLERRGQLERNFVDPPIKDTVTVPDGGYTIVRFIADNPGYWLFHCHISFHVEVGMGLVFHVGQRNNLPKVPKSFPKCGSWMPEPTEDLQTQVDQWSHGVELNLLSGSSESDYVPYKVTNSGMSKKSQATPTKGGTAESCQLSLFAILICLVLSLAVTKGR